MATKNTPTVVADVNSRLSKAELVRESDGTDQIEFWTLPTDIDVIPAADDELVQFDASVRIDAMAHFDLGDVILWDVIAALNGLRELPQDLKVGDVIRIPSQFRVTTEIRGG